MKIWTLWRNDGGSGETPWMVQSYDEYTAEEHGGEPEWYGSERQPGDRELVIELPDSAVTKLFDVPTVKAKVT